MSAVLKTRIDDVRKLLSEDIDPSKEGAKVSAVFNQLNSALDPDNVKSVPYNIDKAITNITGQDGTLVKHVKDVVLEAVKPLKDEIDTLGKELLKQEAQVEALMDTTVKGQAYEDMTVSRLQKWGSSFGVEVNLIGADNKPGDILLNITTLNF